MPKTIEQKRREAAERQAAYDALTVQQKIERLDRAFGVGKGAAKERAKLAKPKLLTREAIQKVAAKDDLVAAIVTARMGKPSRQQKNKAERKAKRLASLPPLDAVKKP